MSSNFKTHDGKVLRGISVTANKFQGVTTLNQITDYGLDKPSSVEKAKAKSSSARVLDAKKMHDNVQRRFDAKRTRRAEVFRGYIENVEANGHIGGTPAITLWNPNILTVVDEGIVIPYGAVIVAIDGETQTEARYLLRDDLPETGNNPIAITMYHGISFAHAQQILHDYNVNCNPVPPKLAASMNHSGPISLALDEVIKESGIKENLINRQGITATKTKPISYNQMLMFMVGYQMGSMGTTKRCHSYVKELNKYDSQEVPKKAKQVLLDILKKASTFFETEKNTNIYSMCSPMVWQVAGGLTAMNVSLNWPKASEAFVLSKVKGSDGKVPRLNEQFKMITEAFKES